MPRVGSSKMIARGCIASHLASTTFCWLPPESVPTSVATPGARMPRRRRSVSASAALRAAVDQAHPRQRRQLRQRDVLGDGEVEHDARGLAVLRHQVDALRRSRRAASRPATAPPVEPDRPPSSRVDAEDRPRQLGPPGADQPGEAEDLAPPHREVDRARPDSVAVAKPAISSSGSPGGAAGGW